MSDAQTLGKPAAEFLQLGIRRALECDHADLLHEAYLPLAEIGGFIGTE